MHLHFIIHEIFEGPGAFLTWAEINGHVVSYSRVYEQEPLPYNIEDIDILIVLGGPQSPSTTKEMCPHFDAVAEISVIQKCIEANKAVIGVCLGAQLIGEALGASHEHSPEKEIGTFPVTLTEEGKMNELFSHFTTRSTVGHWHSDMPGLTKNSKILAFSEGCPRQIVEYSELVYGFQCHMEFTPELIELLIEHSKQELEKYKGNRFVQSPEQLRNNNYTTMNNQLYAFLDRLTSHYQQKKVRLIN
ncbi:type 1 glutamine amidotransferase [Bacillus wiedmannii]|uniref:type 1 glutamine amidotransferase n=1 Tax=Bacillus wiedmannii TaxID=1890302 RepID=UPI000B434603|nr:GMP synthase [Bacillus thuringiensis serovar argentinensis]HEF1906177.1 type 1 glutamine amidotransferase [Bacillus cereus]